MKLEITERESEVRPVLRIGCDCEPTPRERRRLVLPEERLLLFRGGEIGPRRLSIVREVEMLGSQRRLVEEDAGRELVQLSPPRTSQRRIDPVAHECMDELEPIGRAPQERVAQEGLAVVARVVDQSSQRRKRKALAKHGSRLDRAPVVGCEQIRAGKDDALDGCG